jgi:DNA-binding LacI/PurR family transcriptional regulator
MTPIGSMKALRERGLSVPQDIALVCFDDVEHLAVLSPFLTVVDQPAETLGSLGAQLLLGWPGPLAECFAESLHQVRWGHHSRDRASA